MSEEKPQILAVQGVEKRTLSSTALLALTLLTAGLLFVLVRQVSPVLAQTAPHQPPDTMAARVEACTPCHGNKGEGTSDIYFPRLAGKPSGYLYNQLLAFRTGRRKYPPMNYLLEFLPNDYLQDMADYFAGQRPPLPQPAATAVSDEILRRGEVLVTGGDAASQIPACASCHGLQLTGMEPGIPGLLGLRPNYVSAQLGAWRYGTRTAKSPDCMQRVAAKLTEADVTAVAAYLATLPASENAAPLPKGIYVLPFACGSAPN
uniref:c-type cytochrome n=1 Tax=Bradyrhizobium sp. (strain ORS 278) TaxID=114615 RepID=UPI0009FF3BD1|nr:c-type cytochrome [Bradyrhizobium sp. ORS 278]